MRGMQASRAFAAVLALLAELTNTALCYALGSHTCVLPLPPAATRCPLQTSTVPPIPALRLLLVVSLLALAFLLLLDAAKLAVAVLAPRRHQTLRADGKQGSRQPAASDVEAPAPAPAAGESTGGGSSGTLESCGAGSGTEAEARQAAEAERRRARPDVPLRRGLSGKLLGMEAAHPQLHRCLAHLGISVSMACAGGCQLEAPGFVDAAIGERLCGGRDGGWAVVLRGRLVWRGHP